MLGFGKRIEALRPGSVDGQNVLRKVKSVLAQHRHGKGETGRGSNEARSRSLDPISNGFGSQVWV